MSFIDDLNKVIEGGLIERCDGMLTIPAMENKEIRSMTVADLDLSTREVNWLGRSLMAEGFCSDKKEFMDVPLTTVVENLSKLKHIKGISPESIKKAKTKILSTMYDALTVKEKSFFWCDFISYNSLTLHEMAARA